MEAANDVVKTLAKIVEYLREQDDRNSQRIANDLDECIDKLLGVKNEIA